MLSDKEKNNVRKNLEDQMSYRRFGASFPTIMFVMFLIFIPIYNIFSVNDIEFGLGELKMCLFIFGVIQLICLVAVLPEIIYKKNLCKYIKEGTIVAKEVKIIDFSRKISFTQQDNKNQYNGGEYGKVINISKKLAVLNHYDEERHSKKDVCSLSYRIVATDGYHIYKSENFHFIYGDFFYLMFNFNKPDSIIVKGKRYCIGDNVDVLVSPKRCRNYIFVWKQGNIKG